MRTPKRSVIVKVSETLGYCCLYKMLEETKFQTASSLAQKWGVAARTIRQRRRELGKTCRCQNFSHCQAKVSTPQGQSGVSTRPNSQRS